MPFGFDLEHTKPVSSLKNVTRSINPDRLSGSGAGASVRNSNYSDCPSSCWQEPVVGRARCPQRAASIRRCPKRAGLDDLPRRAGDSAP